MSSFDIVVSSSGFHGSIVVYGSVAKGEAREDGDIDVPVVGMDKEIRSKVSEIGYDVDYENGFETFITLIYFTSQDLEYRGMVGSPFIHEVLRGGVAVYDDGTFKRIRQKNCLKMTNLRVPQKSFWRYIKTDSAIII